MQKLEKREGFGICVGVIILLSVYGRPLQQFIVSRIDSIWFVIISFGLLLGLITRFLLKQEKRPSYFLIAVLFMLLASGVSGVYFQYLRPVESVHFFIFFICGYLATSFGVIWGVVALTCVAVGDEILQYFLPSRVGDLHDVAINFLSGVVGFLVGEKK